MKNEGYNALYRQIMKGTAVFGGTGLITMLANIVKGKLVAVLLSDYGMGISSLMQSALNPVQQLFLFGLPTVGVKEIATEGDAEKKAQKVLTFRRILYTLAFFGMCTMTVCATLFSISTFGDDTHAVWFVEMSVALLFFILAAGENTILQGYRRLKALAACNLIGVVSGLVFSIPLYYFYGVEGIVPAMIVLAVMSYGCTRYFTRRIAISPQQETWRETWSKGYAMLMFGGAMMIAGVIGTLSTYFVNTFIRSYGSISDVGLFQAANTITLQCTSLVFTAMATDYYPHLSSVLKQKKEAVQLVEQEGEIVMLVMATITALLILFAPLIVRVLLTEKFDGIVPLLRLIALSFIGRAFCFPLDYVCLAKGDKAFFFWVDGVWTNAKTFLLFVVGYYFFGLIGLGYATVANALIDIVVSSMLNKWRYDVHYSKAMLEVFLPLTALNILALAATCLPNTLLSIGITAACVLTVCIFSYIQLDRRIGIKDLWKKYGKR